MRLILLATLVLPTLAFAQGALTPPAGAFSGGAPAPSMRSLDQIEPRIPLAQPANSTAGLTISAPGSYYLTGNVTVAAGNAITISASNVTLDLNGFTLSTTAASVGGTAIDIPGTQHNIIVRNGVIDSNITIDASTGDVSGSGFSCGIFSNGSMSNCLVSHVNLRGIATYGIYLDEGSTIDHCVAENCGDTGLRAQVVTHSTAKNCRSGIFGTVLADCYATNARYDAISAAETATNCSGESRTGHGLFATTATNCTGISNSGIGLQAIEATGCHGVTNTGVRGLHAQNTATGCTGEITTATCPSNTPLADTPRGLSATTAENCTGTIATANGCGFGLYATTATNCTGKIAAGSDPSYSSAGLAAETATGCTGECPHCPGLGARVATNCTGSSTNSWGLAAGTATNCYGYSAKFTGLKAHGTATGCRGSTSGTGAAYAIEAAIAVACTAESGTIVANSKLLGTP